MRLRAIAVALGGLVGFSSAAWSGDRLSEPVVPAVGSRALAFQNKKADSRPAPPIDPAPLPGTRPLTWDGDIASRLVEGVDRFLLRQLEHSEDGRAKFWKRDLSTRAQYEASVEPNRRRLAHILGDRDARVPFDGPELVGTTAQPALVGRGTGYDVYSARWPVFGDVHGEGLLLVPTEGRKPVADIVAIPDADQTPEQIAGLVEGVPAESQYARRLAESGCRVLVPVLIDRGMNERRIDRRPPMQIANRGFLSRPAFEMGRPLIGFEVQKVLAAVDWFTQEGGNDAKIGVFGWGEGALLALDAGALDLRIDAVGVSGYFDDRRDVWREPIDRNIFGLLEQFGDAELASLVAPRALVIEAARAPELVVVSSGAGPARLVTPDIAVVRREVARARQLVEGLKPAPRLELIVSDGGTGPFGSAPALEALLDALTPGAKLAPPGSAPQHWRPRFDPRDRQRRQIHEIDQHTQEMLADSPAVRRQFMARLNTSSLDRHSKSVEWYRDYFRDEVVGRFEEDLLPPNARSRHIYDEPTYDGYEVVLDVFPDVIAYGVLLVPKGLHPGEKRPVVVCQHGLEGRPQELTDPHIRTNYYNQFGNRLAERGFVIFAPQNLYLFGDRFRVLQRMANPLKKTTYSIMVPQHQQITDWLKAQPFVDPARIGFYGLSYGGITAMFVPPLVPNYCLSICSGVFNDWIDKSASTRNPLCFVWFNEYEMFYFDLGNTFNYSDMAALIAPRPFMVERGHFDGVSRDETVASEFAKVRFLYEARLRIGDRCELEWFNGPHTIHGVGTFDFLHKHLNWPKR